MTPAPIHFTTVTGRRLDLRLPCPDDFVIFDIATGLANLSRFTGQVWPFYSVAQHSLLVAALVPSSLRRRALMHDGSEAYMNDLSRHLKHSEFLTGYRDIEGRVQRAIDARFFGSSLDPTSSEHKWLKLADDLAAAFEHTVLREQKLWKATTAIPYLLGRGFLRGDAVRQQHLIELAHLKLPDGVSYDALGPTLAREVFLRQWESEAYR